jgi:DNA-binding NarL/FixJ family response regulator
MAEGIRVAIVEDDTQTLASFGAIIEGTPGLALVGRYTSAEEAVKKLPGTAVDVVLTDLEMPGMSGSKLVKELRRHGVKAEVVVVTVHDEPDTIFSVLQAGANGYLVKPLTPARLVEAIQEVHAKGAPMSGPIARLVINTFRERSLEAESELDVLTNREREVLEQLARGYRYKEIAANLCVSVRTVTTHLHRIYEKLHVGNATAAVGKYLAH